MTVNVDQASGLVVLGGAMSANDQSAFIRREIEILQQALALQLPILGICLGAQLLGKALGAKVSRNGEHEVGWYNVHFTQYAATDPLFHGLNQHSVFQWHYETFDIPHGASLLAYSSRCANQAFRYSDFAWGMQFHLEVTPEIIANWANEDALCAKPELDEPVDPGANQPHLANFADAVFSRWAEIVIQRMKNNSDRDVSIRA